MNRFIALRVVVGAMAIIHAWAAQPAALPRTLAEMERGESVTLLVAGDSLVAGIRTPDVAANQIDAPGAPSSWVGHFARLLSQRFPAARVVLVYRAPEIDADGVATCRVSPTTERVIQGDAASPQTITIIRDGVGGNNVWRLLARWDKDAARRFPASERGPEAWQPTAVIVAVGVNDSLGNRHPLTCYPDRHRVTGAGAVDLRRRGESVEGFRTGLAATAARLRAMVPRPEIAIATPPGTHPAADTEPYAQAVRNAGAGVIDLARRARVPGDVDACQRHPWYVRTDCLHPNDRGYMEMAQAAFDEAFGP